MAMEAGKFNPRSINKNTRRLHPRIMIKQPYICKKLEGLIFTFWAERFHLCSIYGRAEKFYSCIAMKKYGLTLIQLMFVYSGSS